MLKHGSLDDAGYMFTQTYGGKKHSIAYLTDCSFIDENSFALLERNRENLECLVIDGLREKMHSTHFSFDQALEAANRIGARNTYLIHMSHDLSHVEIERYVDDRIEKYAAGFVKNVINMMRRNFGEFYQEQIRTEEKSYERE